MVLIHIRLVRFAVNFRDLVGYGNYRKEYKGARRVRLDFFVENTRTDIHQGAVDGTHESTKFSRDDEVRMTVNDNTIACPRSYSIQTSSAEPSPHITFLLFALLSCNSDKWGRHRIIVGIYFKSSYNSLPVR